MHLYSVWCEVSVEPRCRGCQWLDRVLRGLIRSPFFANSIIMQLLQAPCHCHPGLFTQGTVTQPTTRTQAQNLKTPFKYQKWCQITEDPIKHTSVSEKNMHIRDHKLNYVAGLGLEPRPVQPSKTNLYCVKLLRHSTLHTSHKIFSRNMPCNFPFHKCLKDDWTDSRAQDTLQT